MNAPVAAAEPDIVSKSEFARLSNVSPARVSQWIAEGQIKDDALVGEGRSARVRVSVARAQLRRHLDIGQRMGNGLSTRLDGPAPEQIEAPLAPGAAPDAQVLPFQRPAPPSDPVEEKIKAARLEGLSRDNRKKAEEEAARSGRYTRTDDVAKQFGRLGSQMVNTFEGWLGEAASKIAARFALPQRDVLHLMRAEFRSFRAGASASLRQQAGELPQTVEDDLETEPDEEAR